MAAKQPLTSEGKETEAFLAELEKDAQVKEIAGLESGFPNLSRALNGILPGLYLLVGPPSCGKTAFAKQLCDQVAQSNGVPAIFYTFAETKKDLRTRTLARLSGLENREIRRGSSFALHWYGVPKRRGRDPERMPPSWEKLKTAAEEARSWFDLLYLFEGIEKTDIKEIGNRIRSVKEIKGAKQAIVVIDDCQRLGLSNQPFDARLPLVAEELQGLAVSLEAPVLATWPDLNVGRTASLPQEWAERVASADVVFVMEEDLERTKRSTEPSRAIKFHIVKNRRGERGELHFDFSPSFSKFTEVSLDASL